MSKKMENGKQYKVIVALKDALNKSYEDAVIEDAIDNLEDLIIEVESHIAHIKTSRIPSAEIAITRAERSVVKAEKVFEDKKKTVTANLSIYVSSWNAGKKAIDEANKDLSAAKSALETEKMTLSQYQEMLEYLTAKE